MMNPIDELIMKGIEEGAYPGAALCFSRGAEIYHRAVYGHAVLRPQRVAVRLETYFDVASLTKVMATTAIMMRFVERGVVDLNQKISAILPVFSASPYKEVRIHHLLAHTSGLPDYRPYFKKLTLSEVERCTGAEMSERYLQWIAVEEPCAGLGEKHVYSDLGFIVLGAAIERLSGRGLAAIFREEVCEPLSLNHTAFHMQGETEPPVIDVAATEDNAWRGRLLCGEVHDENAYALGGAAGHAGLFSTLDDVHHFATAILEAFQGASPWLSQDTCERFLAREAAQSLGWDRPAPRESQAGHHFSNVAIGHLAFTGCSLWLDTKTGVIAVLLTNRIHPDRNNIKLKEIRPRIHDALFEYYVAAKETA